MRVSSEPGRRLKVTARSPRLEALGTGAPHSPALYNRVKPQTRSTTTGTFVNRLVALIVLLAAACGGSSPPQELAVGRLLFSSTGDTIERAMDITVRDSFVLVLDIMASRIRVFDREGRFIRTLGAPGEGPGEFRGMAHVDFASPDTVVVSDAPGSRMVVFTVSDGHVDTRLTPVPVMSFAYRNGTLFAPATVPGRLLMAYDDTAQSEVPGEFEGFDPADSDGLLGGFRYSVTASDNALFVVDMAEGTVWRVDGSGATQRMEMDRSLYDELDQDRDRLVRAMARPSLFIPLIRNAHAVNDSSVWLDTSWKRVIGLKLGVDGTTTVVRAHNDESRGLTDSQLLGNHLYLLYETEFRVFEVGPAQ